MRNWREWFIPPDDEDIPLHQAEDEVRLIAGSGHRGEDNPLVLEKKMPPRCASCKRFMGHDTGMHIMISRSWRIHIECFSAVLERHYEEGEVIDLTTGAICKVDLPDTHGDGN
jgi:hypothetical protein